MIVYQKDFESWSACKQKTHAGTPRWCHPREIWWASLGVNIGSEIDGKNELFERPIVVVKRLSPDVIFCVPLTTKARANWWYFPIQVGDTPNFAVLTQARAIGTQRLIRKFDAKKVDVDIFKKLQKSLIQALIDRPHHC